MLIRERTLVYCFVMLAVVFGGVVFGVEMSSWPSEVMKLRPVVYYDMEADPADMIVDGLMGNSFGEVVLNDGALPGFVDGPKGKAWDMTATNAYLRVRGSSIHTFGDVKAHQGLSIAMWVKDGGTISNERYAGSGYGRVFDMLVQSGWLRIVVDGVSYQFAASQTILDGQWHHVVLSIDFSSSVDNIKLYSDGVECGTYSKSFVNKFQEYRSDHPMYLGCRYIPGGSPAKVAIDDFAMFDYPLSQADVLTLKDYTPGAVSVAVPEVEAGRTIVKELGDNVVDLSAVVSNVAAGASYQWTLVEQGANGVVLSNADSINAQAEFDPEGEYDAYRFRIRVTTADTFAEDDVMVVFHDGDTPASRVFSAVPAAGVHPRILFSPEDIPELRARYNSVPSIIRSASYNKTHMYHLSGATYDKLKAGDDSAVVTDDAMADEIARRAYIALMEEDTAKLNELATVLGTMCSAYSRVYEPNYSNYLVHDASMHIGLAYDFLYNYMSAAERDATRSLISKMTKHRHAYGVHNHVAADVSSNWKTFHDNIVICSLAIEGEQGYDKRVFEANLHKLRTFLTQYGIHKNGFGHEGVGYFTFGMEKGIYSILAAARRDENFFDTTRLYKSGVATFHEVQMWEGATMYSHHDGQGWGNGYYIGNYYWVMGYAFPNDRFIDHLVGRYRDSAYNEDRKSRLASMIFAKESIPGNDDIAVAGQGLPLSLFEPERGIVNMRSAWDSEAIRMDFECRMDAYYLGHIHSDRNSFNFMALERMWFTDSGYHDGANDLHATVLIDGLGHDGTSTMPSWPALPGQFLDYHDQGDIVMASGDAKITYSYDRNNIGNAVTSANYTWADFVYPGTDPADIPEWKNASIGTLYEYNPVERAFRSVFLVRGENPYAIVVDDIQKDDSPHTYEWLANVPQGDQIVTVSSSTDQIILRHKDDTERGTPRLLVRAIEAKGPGVIWDMYIDERANGQYNPGSLHKMLILMRYSVVAPDFKVLIYPFRDGDVLPLTTWDGSELTVEIPGKGTRTFEFEVNQDGRTVMTNLTRCPEFSAGGNLVGDDAVTMEDLRVFSENWGVCFGLDDLATLTLNWLAGQ